MLPREFRGETLALGADHSLVVTIDLFNKVQLLDLTTGKALIRLQGDQYINRACLSPDSRRMATLDRRGIIKLWSVEDGQELWTSSGAPGSSAPCRFLSFSLDGKCILSASENGIARLWECAPRPPESQSQRQTSALLRYYSTEGFSLDQARTAIRSSPWRAMPFQARAVQLLETNSGNLFK